MRCGAIRSDNAREFRWGIVWSLAAVLSSGFRLAAQEAKQVPADAVAVRLRFSDGRVVRATIPIKKVAITTDYGRLEIPIEDIRTIELAPRLSEDVNKKVQDAIARLASPKAEDRAAAGPALFNLREKSFVALLRATKSRDKALAKRASDLVEDLRRLVPPAMLEVPVWDVIETDNSRFAGDVDVSAFKIQGFRLAVVEANRVDRQVAQWVFMNKGHIWIGDTQVDQERWLPAGDFSIERISLCDPSRKTSETMRFNRTDIDRLGSLTNLINLEFSSAAVTDDVVRRLSRLKSLERLVLSGTKITDACLPSLAGMKRLNRLDVSYTAITDRGLEEIARLKSLTDLSIVPEEQRKGREQPHPPDLFLNETGTTEAAIARLQEALPNCMISASHLFADQHISELVPLPPRPGATDGTWAGWLLGYRIGNCELYPAAFPKTAFTKTERLPPGELHIVKLAFDSATAPREWSTPLARLMLRRLGDLPHLRELDFGRLPSSTFPGLAAHRRLTTLVIDETDAADGSMEVIGGLTALTHLRLRAPFLTGHGLTALGRLKQLKTLDLSGCKRLEGASLVSLTELPVLNMLSLNGCPIDDTAVEPLKRMKSLATLNLSQTRVTQQELRELRTALPKCTIVFSAGPIAPSN